jgi:hypothetical protein
MKAIVIEVNDKYVLAMNKHGEFIKIRDNGNFNFEVGHEIDTSEYYIPVMRQLTRIGSMAAILLLMFGILFGAYSYSAPYSFVNIDINPSLEATANRYDRIINMEGLNDDGKNLLLSIDCKNKKIEDGIKSILDSAANNGYLGKETEDDIMFTISSKCVEKADEIADKIKDSFKDAENLNVSRPMGKPEIKIEKISMQKHDEAKKIGVSSGKLLLIEELIEDVKEDKPEIKAEDFKDIPAKNIKKLIEDRKKDTGNNKNIEEIKEKQSEAVKQEKEDKKGKEDNANKDNEDNIDSKKENNKDKDDNRNNKDNRVNTDRKDSEHNNNDSNSEGKENSRGFIRENKSGERRPEEIEAKDNNENNIELEKNRADKPKH